MSYDKEIIKQILKEKNYGDEPVDYDKVLETVEYDNGKYIFMIGDVGFVFVGNILIDVLPGYKRVSGVIQQ